MAKKSRKSTVEDENPGDSSSILEPPLPTSQPKKQAVQPSTSSLIICRNKHWRYISSFHGPWLQLPPEVLESLANNNYSLPRPRPIDPAVFYDLLKIRRLVDEATDLSVRASSGVASSALSNFHNGSNGLLGNGGSALGLGIGGGGGGNAKLSRERKHRMREQATQKLSKAYHLDEIACSVATMQATSTLEDVAQFVLQRNPMDSDAKYTHFFHEKIPSRQLAECTSLQPLDEIIVDRPTEAEPLRTRALTKIFKEDYFGAAQDLTAALQICRYYQGLHKAGRQQLQLASEAAAEAKRNGRRREEVRVDDEDQPSSLESQLLFQRAGVYLTIACQHVDAALPPKSNAKPVNGANSANRLNGSNGLSRDDCLTPAADEWLEETPAEKETRRKGLEARKTVKTYAKRALRDYVAFLSHLDYTPGLSADVKESFVRQVNEASNGIKAPKSPISNKAIDMDGNNSLSNGQLSDALVPHRNSYPHRHRPQNGSPQPTDIPNLPTPVVHQMSSLFSATPPADLPPFPVSSTELATRQESHHSRTPAVQAILSQSECHESLTYHPLLTDALHSLLLCHCLIQTSARELQRHAHMVARLVRVCDGYPVFQSARSPSRADWTEIVRRTNNWINLSQSWESLCIPATLPAQGVANQQKESPEQRQERLKQQAIMEALEDDRVHDEESFHAAVMARQRRQEDESKNSEGTDVSKRYWAQDDGKDYPISTDRASAVVRWIKEAPVGAEGEPSKKKKKKKRVASHGGNCKTAGLESSISDLRITDDGEVYDQVEEEVD